MNAKGGETLLGTPRTVFLPCFPALIAPRAPTTAPRVSHSVLPSQGSSENMH